MTDEELLAREMHDMVVAAIAKGTRPLMERIAELERRVVTIEAANTLRAGYEALSARLDRVEQKGLIRLANKGAA
jgi:hypothetical protein